ncbi:MAG: VOC family protein [Edaphobacter sp.]
MANPFCHMELDTTDPAKAKAFYSALFDWKITDMDMGGGMIYSTFKPSNDSPGGGMMQHPMPGASSTWLAYVLVDDVAAASRKAVSLGAKIVVDKQEVPNMGWFCVIVDPTGAHLGLWETSPSAPRP